MYKVKCGPTVYVDVDDTLAMWEIPEGYSEELISVNCGHFMELVAPNKYNIQTLKKLAARGHNIVVWSASGSDWAEAVVKAFSLEEFVDVVVSKPYILIDDMPNIEDAVGGKLGYLDMEGKRHGHQNKFTQQKDD